LVEKKSTWTALDIIDYPAEFAALTEGVDNVLPKTCCILVCHLGRLTNFLRKGYKT
jgi:hypothetical protein